MSEHFNKLLGIKNDDRVDTTLMKISKSNIVISLDKNGDLQIIKNRYGDNIFTRREVDMIISKLISKTILDNRETLKFFKGSLEDEILDMCNTIFEKWGISYSTPGDPNIPDDILI